MSDTHKLDQILAKLESIERRQEAILLDQRVLYRQIEGLMALYQQIEFRQPLIGLRGWVASPDILAILAALLRQYQPDVIVELGGGQSTVVTGYMVRQLQRGHVYALEHQAEFAERIHENIARHALSDFVTVVHAPLITYTINGEEWQWYDLASLPQAMQINLLFIDGPAQHGNTKALVRYPALPLLRERLVHEALIVMDDADRAAEQQVLAAWRDEYTLTPMRHYDSNYGDTEKGAQIFRWSTPKL